MHIYIYIYIYIYRERERNIHLYIYIYIYTSIIGPGLEPERPAAAPLPRERGNHVGSNRAGRHPRMFTRKMSNAFINLPTRLLPTWLPFSYVSSYLCCCCITTCEFVHLAFAPIARGRGRRSARGVAARGASGRTSTYIFMYIYIYIYVYVCVYVYTCIHIHICMHTNISIYIHIHTYLSHSLSIHINIYIYIYVYRCIHLYRYMHIRVYRCCCLGSSMGGERIRPS